METNALIGHIVTAIFLAEDRQAIKFTLDDGREVIASCDGDCCSHTWIEDLVGEDAAISAPVLSVVDLDLPEELRQLTKTDNYEEEMQYYGCGIQTVKGRFLIAYRNSSNGYYGGSLLWGDAYLYGVMGQNVSKEVWRQIAPARTVDAVDPADGKVTE